MQTIWDILVIGGGAAGFFGALASLEARPGLRVLVLEKANVLLGKVKVSGGGRCNVTNAQFDPARLVENYPRGGQALRGPLTRFGPRETVAWFKRHGVALKDEPDGRMFPVTDNSQTVIDCFLDQAGRSGMEFRTRAPVRSIDKDGELFRVILGSGEAFSARRVLLATGGDRGGFALAESLGHEIISPAPSLFTFTLRDPRLEGLAGVSVEDARLRLPQAGLEQRGPLLVTHWGLSGPAALKLSAWGARSLHEAGYQADLIVDWLPEYNPDSFYRLLQEVKASHPKAAASAHDPAGRLPARLWKRLTSWVEIGEEQPWGEVAKGKLARMAEEITRGQYRIEGKGQFKEEFVTAGGVNLKEVDFKTMQSRRAPGLYLAGEVLDIDGVTGGFNFQSAWTTAWIAGQAMANMIA